MDVKGSVTVVATADNRIHIYDKNSKVGSYKSPLNFQARCISIFADLKGNDTTTITTTTITTTTTTAAAATTTITTELLLSAITATDATTTTNATNANTNVTRFFYRLY